MASARTRVSLHGRLRWRPSRPVDGDGPYEPANATMCAPVAADDASAGPATGRLAPQPPEDRRSRGRPVRESWKFVDRPGVVGLYLQDVGRARLLSPQEEASLAAQVRAGDQEAQRRLVISNLRLVVSVAARYLGRGLELADLIQAGNLGLLRAAEKYDERNGLRFSTYAIWWIRQAVARTITSEAHLIRLPEHLDQAVRQVRRTRWQLMQMLGRWPSSSEVADALQSVLDAGVLSRALRVQREIISLDAPVEGSEDLIIADVVADEGATAPAGAAEGALLREAVHAALQELPVREAEVIRLRFGLAGHRECTLKEVGRHLGISHERVRQIESSALRKLHYAALRLRLREHLD